MINKLNKTTNNDFPSPKHKKNPALSYRNQSDIMRKIFGNDQNYKQIKSLFKDGDYSYNINVISADK